MVVATPTLDFVCPFSLEPDPMKFLFLYNFDGDDEYNGFEYQYFDDDIKGQGSLVIMWRTDGKVDFYMTPGVHLNREKADVAAGIGAWTTTEFESHYEVTSRGLNLEVNLVLKDGRSLHVVVRENRKHDRKPMTILAPMGAGIEKPVYLPFFWLKDIDLVQVANTEACLAIGEDKFAASRIPIPIPYSRAFCYFARYCTDPFMVNINPSYTGRLPLLSTDKLTGFTHEGMQFELKQLDDLPGIEKITYNDKHHQLAMQFEPAFPNLISVQAGARTNGNFTIGVDHQQQVIQGEYRVSRDNQEVQIKLAPTENWKPHGSLMERLTLRLFPSVFRTWPRTFSWIAQVDLSQGSDNVTMTSRWDRVQ